MFPPPAKAIKNPEQEPKPDDDVADDKATDENKADKAEKPDAVAVSETKLPDHPTKPIFIGSDDPKTGYGLKVTLSTVGASVVAAELNDPRYKALKPRKPGRPRRISVWSATT